MESIYINELKSVLTPELIKKFIPYKNQYDPNRFNDQDKNAETICNIINSRGNCKAITVKEYFKLATGRDADSLNYWEWADYDSKNGDIIFIDDSNKPLCKVDLKVSNNYLGSITLSSIINFDKNGIYACCKLSTGEVKIITHSNVELLAKSGYLTAPLNDYKGKPVIYNGQNVTTEHFIKGLVINKYL
jgi:hypothetical protein